MNTVQPSSVIIFSAFAIEFYFTSSFRLNVWSYLKLSFEAIGSVRLISYRIRIDIGIVLIRIVSYWYRYRIDSYRIDIGSVRLISFVRLYIIGSFEAIGSEAHFQRFFNKIVFRLSTFNPVKFLKSCHFTNSERDKTRGSSMAKHGFWKTWTRVLIR